MSVFHPRYIRWTLALLPALVAPVVSLFMLLSGFNQTAPVVVSARTAVPWLAAAMQPESTPAAAARPPVVTAESEGRPVTSVPGSIASTTGPSTLPESGVATVGSIPVQFNLLSPTKVLSPTATRVPTRKPVNTPTASAPRAPVLVSRAANTVEPEKTRGAAQTPVLARTPEPDKAGEPDDKGEGREPDDRGKDEDGK
jgi:hypothetical protein